MEKDYQRGYICANEFNWQSLPIDRVIALIDGYKQKALEKNSWFFAGLAQAAWDILLTGRKTIYE